MALLTDLFVANEADAKSYDAASARRFSAAQFSGLTNLEFETLWAILLGEEWEGEKHALTPIAETESTWTFRFPPQYVLRLTQTTPREAAAAAAAWAATEEISADASDVAPIITTLIALAKSVQPSRGLFVWTAL